MDRWVGHVRRRHWAWLRPGVMAFVGALRLLSVDGEISHAAEPVVQSPAVLLAQANQAAQGTVEFNIPAQELNSALLTFADRSGVQVFYDADRMTGLHTQGVAGPFTWQDALRQLLLGTGMEYRVTGERTVTIQKSDSADLVPGAIAAGAAVGVGAGAAAAAAAADSGGASSEGAAGGKPVKVPEILVKDVKKRETQELDNLPPEYAGGDVARGGRVGILGNKDIMDTPFTQMNYTSKLVQDQQVRFLTDVLRNDPSVQIVQPASTGFTNFSIRGFPVGADSTFFNGFMGIAPTADSTMMTEGAERFEVLRGPSALLNGAAPGNTTGGMINVVPKRAGEEALTQLTAQYISDTQFGGHADISRRFGKDNQFGVRINGVYRNGDLPVNHSSLESALVTAGLDYRGDFIRLSADFGYQQQEARGARRQFGVGAGVTALPEPPDLHINANQPWEFNDTRVLYGTLRGEIDVNKYLTALAGFGTNWTQRESIFTNREIDSSAGTLSASGNTVRQLVSKTQILTFDAGLRGSFHTGPVHHQTVAAYTLYSSEFRLTNLRSGVPASNIYNPVFAPEPPASNMPTLSDAKPFSETQLSGAVLGDTLSILDKRVELTAGVRFQQIKSTNFDATTGAVTSDYDKSAATPMVGLVVKPWKNVSVYGNYVEGLQQGPTAPANAANFGEVFAPFVSKGYEVGTKVDFGRIVTTLAAFQITQPSGFINPATNVFGVDGEQRNRGIEFTAFGEVMEGLRLLGGTSYIDAELTKTAGGVNEGNKAPIFPFQFTLYGEWDLPFMKALTLTSRVTHASSQYINIANTQQIREWTQLDIGARYRFERSNGKPITVRANLDNALNTNAWYGSSSGNSIFVRDPRTFLLSATFDF
ncbi:putative tonB-dependent receptor protein [Nitrospira japonica]|uniref:Putative tonB-dependent receptor protein n=1 Tax=Nitrospira japonica TaxID=1325564 RepID=A0A1W1IBE9_9BACT|nr:TonB-dependent receptor [Nitrospira japonica]SLM50093.1 putative tonB-dependent receptor protein [Nitrospira japonica]